LLAGNYYWLAFNSSASVAGYDLSTGAIRYKAAPYSGFSFPDPIGSGFASATNSNGVIAGWGILILSPSSINQPVSYGSPKFILSIKPASIAQPIACGTPTIIISGIVVSPQGTAVIISYATPTLRYPQTISPANIVQLVAVGTPWVGIFGFIRPESTIQQISLGGLTILKYVWHVILDGQYATETPGVNRAYIIGRDQYGNPVYGTAVNTDEVDLVGERLDFQPDPAIPTTAQAADVASALLSRMRLMGKRGVIFIPPNCGQELFDVVQISDSGANQTAVKFRVVGIRFEYNPGEALYLHKLILSAA
jgi:hypothetical protein